MSKEKNFQQFDREHFDTIIIDECHHAASLNYQKIIQKIYLKKKFLKQILTLFVWFTSHPDQQIFLKV